MCYLHLLLTWRTIPIKDILTVLAFQSGLMIAVRMPWLEWRSLQSCVWLHAIIDDYCLLPLSEMTRLCFHADIDDRCQLLLSAGTRLWLHADIYDCCQLPSSAGTIYRLVGKRCWVDSPQYLAKMFATVKELWTLLLQGVPGPVSCVVHGPGPVLSAIWCPAHLPSDAWTISLLMPHPSAICCPFHWLSDSRSRQPVPVRSRPHLQEVSSTVPSPIARLVPGPIPGPVGHLIPGPVGCQGLGQFVCGPGPNCNGSQCRSRPRRPSSSLTRSWSRRPPGSRTRSLSHQLCVSAGPCAVRIGPSSGYKWFPAPVLSTVWFLVPFPGCWWCAVVLVG